MNIGIIVYSRTGHTLTVATELKEKLAADGHEVTLEQVEIVGPDNLSVTEVQLKTKPDVTAYDVLVFGSPVRGGLVPPAMASYLEQVTSLQSKKVAFLVTHFFHRGWGTNQTLSQMQEVCEAKGATVCGTGDVGWPRPNRKRQIADVVDSLSKLFERD